MAHERSTIETHTQNPNQQHYDWEYYKVLLPYIKGEVLDIGSGAGMFVKEYAKKDEVTSVVAIDKYIDEMPEIPKVIAMQFNLPNDFAVSKDSARFDTIVSTEFIEHIKREELEPLLEKVKLSLKPNGVFIGSTPNKISPTTNEFHLYEYTLNELASIMRSYFGEVELWDDGQNCTIWVAKL